MRTSRSLLFFTTFLLYLTTLTAAWPFPFDKIFPRVDSLIVREAFVKRADSSGTDSTQPSQTASASAAAKTSDSNNSDSPSPSASDSGSAASGSGSNSNSDAKTTAKASATAKESSNSTITSSSTISIDANAAAGGLEMLIPDTTSGSYFYKISDYVTFAWNYTSLSITPTAIDVLVTCTSNSQMYTIATNMSVNGNATGAVTWDTNNYPEKTSAPLLTAIYTMYIFDADSSVSAVASAGHLGVFDYAFGMYTKTPYTPYAEWTCGSCSAAFSADERRWMGFMVGMVGVTVLSFTWFVGGTGVIW